LGWRLGDGASLVAGVTAALTVVARLKRAGVLQTAEAAAKRVELRLGDCLAPGDITGGHVAVWQALFKTGKTAAEIAELVGFDERAIAAELAPKRASSAGANTRDVAAIVERAVAPLRAELASLRGSFDAMVAAAAKRRAAAIVEPLKAEIKALRKAAENCAVVAVGGGFDAGQWLTDRGAFGVQIREICRLHCVTPDELLGRPGRAVRRTARIVKARRAAVVYLTQEGCSQPDIAAILRVDKKSVLQSQAIAGIPAAFGRGRRP
jgi:hypothetical protein